LFRKLKEKITQIDAGGLRELHHIITEVSKTSDVPRIFKPGIFSGAGGGFQQIQLRIEGRENWNMGALAPSSGVPLNLQMNEIYILMRLLRMYIPRNWEFGSALAKLWKFGGRGFEPIKPPRYATV
jgi:hypothetical protein